MSDSVNHPAHYGGEDDPYEVIKVLEAWDLELARGFCWGNVIKYTARAGRKDDALADRRKAQWYAQRAVSIDQRLAARSAAQPPPDPESDPVSVYVTVHTGPPESYNCYAVNARTDWTVETLASIVAAGSGKALTDDLGQLAGRWGLSLAWESGLLKAGETVGWLTRQWPPATHDYYLRET